VRVFLNFSHRPWYIEVEASRLASLKRNGEFHSAMGQINLCEPPPFPKEACLPSNGDNLRGHLSIVYYLKDDILVGLFINMSFQLYPEIEFGFVGGARKLQRNQNCNEGGYGPKQLGDCTEGFLEGGI
jgi:hypothetical protein